ncbi:MAG: glycosyltransferase [Cytophagaceae bacterium]|nr:glycosyltransferase [Cytophagaceae bacterium]
MKVSIITVVYNGAATLRSCIESVLGQSHSDLEYIIVDGASTDDTLAIARSFGPKIARLISEPDRGIYDAMNKGIAAATGDVVGILNADDLYAHVDVIKHIADALETQQTDAAYGDLVYVDRNDSRRIRRTWRAGVYREAAFLYGWMPPHPTFFVRREIYERFGAFNPDLRSAADYELMLRLVHKHAIQLSYVPEILVLMRLGGLSNASLLNRLRANREDYRAWVINGLKPYFFTTLWKPLRKSLQFLNLAR